MLDSNKDYLVDKYWRNQLLYPLETGVNHSQLKHFLLMDPVSGTFPGCGFSPIPLSGSSCGVAAVSSCSVLALCPPFLISACGLFSFSVSYAYFVLCCLEYSCFLVYSCRVSAWIWFTSMLLFPVAFFKVLVIISCCILMSELLFGLYFRCCF